MRSLLVLAALIFGFLAIVNNGMLLLLPNPIPVRAVMPLKYAALAAKPGEEKISIPIRNIGAKQFADTWHAPRGSGRLHQGQDIFAPRGTEVFSVVEGYVVRVAENSLGGNTVSVMGAGGRVYYYAHLDGYAPGLAVGDFVTPESVLGYVGSTGNAGGTPPHLHFAVYTLGGAINPLDLF